MGLNQCCLHGCILFVKANSWNIQKVCLCSCCPTCAFGIKQSAYVVFEEVACGDHTEGWWGIICSSTLWTGHVAAYITSRIIEGMVMLMERKQGRRHQLLTEHRMVTVQQLPWYYTGEAVPLTPALDTRIACNLPGVHNRISTPYWLPW